MVNASGRVCTTLVGMGVLLGIGWGCTGHAVPAVVGPGTQTLSSIQTAVPKDFGKAKTWFPCRPKRTLWIPCPNFTRRDFGDTALREQLAGYLRKFTDDGKWSDPTLPIERDVEDGHAPAHHMLRVIRDPREIQFRGNTAGSIVMARMDVHKSSGTDRRYGIAADPTGDDWQQFFLVVELGKPEPNVVHEGHQFGTWSIYRIVKGEQGRKDVIERVGKRGSYRWCVMPHEGVAYENGAQYVSCPTARALQLIEQGPAIASVLQKKHVSLLTAIQQEVGVAAAMSANAPVVESALRTLLGLRETSQEEFHRVISAEQVNTIAEALQAARTAPAWMLCGVGCCTADESD